MKFMGNGFSKFPPEALEFFRQLKRHNNRPWFLKHKEIYEEKVKAPMVELVLALGNEIRNFAPEMGVEPSRAIYRIYRDTRFSHDKSPYKTQIAAVFSPREFPKHMAAGLYFHVSASEVEIAGGVYMPGSAELVAIRRHISEQPGKLRAILERKEFKRQFGGLWGEQLARVPRGFPPDHPAADLLRYKQFLVDVTQPAELATTPDLFRVIIQHFETMMPLVRFLNLPLKRDPELLPGKNVSSWKRKIKPQRTLRPAG
jgi:uncharacterized protein (TIGR02453 family)